MSSYEGLNAEQVIARATEAVVVGYALGVDVQGLNVVIKFKLIDGRKKTYAIPSLGLHELCVGVLGAAVAHQWRPGPPNKSPKITADDWDERKSLMIPTNARPWAFQNTFVLEFVLKDKSILHAMAPGHAIEMAEQILAAIRSDQLHDLSSGDDRRRPMN
jgi:hypothetical protein